MCAGTGLATPCRPPQPTWHVGTQATCLHLRRLARILHARLTLEGALITMCSPSAHLSPVRQTSHQLSRPRVYKFAPNAAIRGSSQMPRHSHEHRGNNLTTYPPPK